MTSRIACAGISGRIIQGRVSADGKSFVGQTKDVTSDVLAAVIDKLKHHGGSFTINCNGEPVATLTLSEAEHQSAPERVSVPVLNKTREQWQKLDAKLVATGSSTAIFHAIRDAQHDIECLHRALLASHGRGEA